MRRHILIATGVALVCFVATGASGAERIAYINSDRIMAEYSGAKDIQSQLQAANADWRARASEMEAEIESMTSEFKTQEPFLSEDAAREKRQAIEAKRNEYESFLNEVWGSGGLAMRREAELWQPVIDRINAILEEIGKEGDYLMILDAAGGGIVYAAPDTDLTQLVIDKLNGEAE